VSRSIWIGDHPAANYKTLDEFLEAEGDESGETIYVRGGEVGEYVIDETPESKESAAFLKSMKEGG